MADALTVRQINHMIKMLLETNALLKRITVTGEITDYRKQSSGHLYFSLKDESGKIRCVQFKNEAAALDFEPENGMEVVVSGRLSVYEATGQYQIIVNTIIPGDTGLLYQKFEALKSRLAMRGWFDEKYKKPLPSFIRRAGIVTSPSGAAIQDMISVITRRDPGIEIWICPAKVQGEGAAAEIAQGIKKLNQLPVDVIIIGRGGGSIEDLWCFNEEIVAEAIHASEIPVISAVGHETDFTISDFTADFRAPTPSVAGEMVSAERERRIEQLADLKNRMARSCSRFLTEKSSELRTRQLRLTTCSPQNRIDRLRMDLDRFNDKMIRSMQHQFQQERSKLEAFKQILPAYDPEKVLRRGYTLVMDQENHLITSVEQTAPCQNLTIRFADGLKDVVVQKEG